MSTGGGGGDDDNDDVITDGDDDDDDVVVVGGDDDVAWDIRVRFRVISTWWINPTIKPGFNIDVLDSAAVVVGAIHADSARPATKSKTRQNIIKFCIFISLIL